MPVCLQKAHLFKIRGQVGTSLSFAQCLINLFNHIVTHFRPFIAHSSTLSSSFLHFFLTYWFTHTDSQPGTVPLWSFCMGDAGPQQQAPRCSFTYFRTAASVLRLPLFTHILSQSHSFIHSFTPSHVLILINSHIHSCIIPHWLIHPFSLSPHTLIPSYTYSTHIHLLLVSICIVWWQLLATDYLKCTSLKLDKL